jgi:hypothetical protein
VYEVFGEDCLGRDEWGGGGGGRSKNSGNFVNRREAGRSVVPRLTLHG